MSAANAAWRGKFHVQASAVVAAGVVVVSVCELVELASSAPM
jgi:hypothetical protein